MPLDREQATQAILKLQKEKNDMYADFAVTKNALIDIREFKCRLQQICRKVGWVLMSITAIILSFDILNLWLGIGKVSPGFGYGQLTASVVIGGLGLLLLLVGHYKR